MKPIIKVEKLSKQYRIGQQEPYRTFRDAFAYLMSAPIRHFRALRGKLDIQDANRNATIWALNDVAFEIMPGEVVGIIGHNGAGKSTLLKILSRITEPTTGGVDLYGRVGSLLEIGTGFHPELTGRENIYLNGAILGMRKLEIDQKFDQIVDFAEIEKFLDTPVKRYSSGMYVRLAFAVAAHLEPEILVVDEVLAVGDAAFQKKCLGQMGEVAKTGRTVLFVSHNMTAISHLCNRALLLEHGTIRAKGSTHEVIDEYQLSLSTLTQKTLGERHDRKGEGGIKFTKIKLLNGSGEQIHTAISGEPVRVVLEYFAARSFSSLMFAISVNTTAGMPLFLCTTDHGSLSERITSGAGQMSCTIKNLPLAQGAYAINVAAFRGTTIYDWVGSALILHVETVDFHKNGASIFPGHSPFLVKSFWQYVDA